MDLRPVKPGGPREPSALPRRDPGFHREPKLSLQDPVSRMHEPTQDPTRFMDQLPIWLDAAGNPAAKPAEGLILCIFQVSNYIDNMLFF